MKQCTVNECNKKVFAKGLCSAHYSRLRRTNSINEHKPLKIRFKHGINTKKHPLYTTWHSMRTRCYTVNSPAYKSYGGRGIKVCERWDNFANFIADMGEKPSVLHQLDRIDNDGDYTPDNCRWTTPAEQARNRRSTKLKLHDITEIKKLYNSNNYTQKEIGNMYNVGQDHISRIVNNKYPTIL